MLDFISNLYKKRAHSLAHESGVTQIIEALPADNPTMALVELTHCLLALSNAEGINLKDRVMRLARIDQSAQKYERALRRQYTEASRMHKALEERIWNASFDFLEATVNAHLRCIERLPKKGGAYDRDLAHVIMRTLCRLDLQAHWLHLRYRPISPLFWGRVFVAIKLAEERELLHLPITLNSAAKTETTIAQEMLKLFMMSVATPEHLTKKQIDLAHLLIQRLAGTFCWEQIPYGSTLFYVDFSKPKTPVRLDKVSEQLFMAHCFGSSEAVSALVVGLKQLAQGGMPTTLGAVDFSNYKREDLLEVMAHLSQCWRKMDAQNVPPYFDKHHASRTQIFDQISVVHSFAVLYAQLAQSAMLRSPPSASLTLSADENETESWVVENISQMGYGVTLAKQKEDWVQHHTLIGIQSDTTPWQIGVIRRVASESVENTHVGIQILSIRSSAVMLRAADTEMSIGEPAVDTQTPHHPLGILMHKALPYQDEESLLLASGSYQLQRIYTMVVGEAQRTIRLLDRINTFQNGDQLIFIDV